MSEVLSIGGRVVGSGRDVFVIAEAGVNHNGSVPAAHQLIDIAADCGAHAVKFQTFRPEQVVSATADSTPYQQRRNGASSQLALLQALTLPDEAWGELAEHTAERGLVFLSTPFDPDSARLLADLGVPAFKIGSGELTNIPFLAEVASYGRPMLLSTGMADLEDVRRALEATTAAEGRALFHCVSAYPAPSEQANLRAIATLHETFGVPVGWSDHTVDSVTAIAAVALGATMIEKHFTLDRAQDGPDHAASLDPQDLRAFVEAILAVPPALGDGRKVPAPAESENIHLVRRSWHLRRPVAQGEIIDRDAVVALRPEGGLPPWVDPVGRHATRDLAAGEPLNAEDIA